MILRRRKKSSVDERLHFQKMFALNREIEKYRKSLENIRPKSSEPKKAAIAKVCQSARSDRNLKINMPTYVVSDDGSLSPSNSMTNCLDEKKDEEIKNDVRDERKEQDEINQIQIPRVLDAITIPSECLIDESYAINGIDVNCSQGSQVENEFRTKLKPMPQFQQPNENFELIITPTVMVNIKDTFRSNLPHDFDRSKQDFPLKPTEYHRESRIAVNQHMSILIKKLSNEIVDTKSAVSSYMNESTEGNQIIKQVFDEKSHDDYILLQRYFLRWIHYNTIEKLKRRNPGQTRLQKMEAFLQNITLERKRALNRLRRPGNLCTKRDDYYDQNKISTQSSYMESPRLLMRTYNNK